MKDLVKMLRQIVLWAAKWSIISHRFYVSRLKSSEDSLMHTVFPTEKVKVKKLKEVSLKLKSYKGTDKAMA